MGVIASASLAGTKHDLRHNEDVIYSYGDQVLCLADGMSEGMGSAVPDTIRAAIEKDLLPRLNQTSGMWEWAEHVEFIKGLEEFIVGLNENMHGVGTKASFVLAVRAKPGCPCVYVYALGDVCCYLGAAGLASWTPINLPEASREAQRTGSGAVQRFLGMSNLPRFDTCCSLLAAPHCCDPNVIRKYALQNQFYLLDPGNALVLASDGVWGGFRDVEGFRTELGRAFAEGDDLVSTLAAFTTHLRDSEASDGDDCSLALWLTGQESGFLDPFTHCGAVDALRTFLADARTIPAVADASSADVGGDDARAMRQLAEKQSPDLREAGLLMAGLVGQLDASEGRQQSPDVSSADQIVENARQAQQLDALHMSDSDLHTLHDAVKGDVLAAGLATKEGRLVAEQLRRYRIALKDEKASAEKEKEAGLVESVGKESAITALRDFYGRIAEVCGQHGEISKATIEQCLADVKKLKDASLDGDKTPPPRRNGGVWMGLSIVLLLGIVALGAWASSRIARQSADIVRLEADKVKAENFEKETVATVKELTQHKVRGDAAIAAIIRIRKEVAFPVDSGSEDLNKRAEAILHALKASAGYDEQLKKLLRDMEDAKGKLATLQGKLNSSETKYRRDMMGADKKITALSKERNRVLAQKKGMTKTLHATVQSLSNLVVSDAQAHLDAARTAAVPTLAELKALQGTLEQAQSLAAQTKEAESGKAVAAAIAQIKSLQLEAGRYHAIIPKIEKAKQAGNHLRVITLCDEAAPILKALGRESDSRLTKFRADAEKAIEDGGQ
jgi:hypothetical protein